ncbi:hypothetical protein nbrc107696_37170 [Gordonia spumicola]|uniref:Uncharacterized protein n=1 Tax=Gordonia spumicola TaxID=589161 RepID=A0A7I9VDP1_9ACTN|nr:DUF5682 family protein [Gordonia spumicola]GEE03271.1 hypothetical protein nbrc107696_37170 [Gordonia spumicola]
MSVRAFGIRHHGPGSALSVSAALDRYDPTFVLVEGPPELTPILPLLADEEMVPPVAGLVYAVDAPRRAAFYPLAEFSPEWVATRWALTRGVDVAWADLPAAQSLAIQTAVDDATTTDAGAFVTARASRVTDPIGELARTAGYDDAERWWEDAVEHRSGDASAQFDAVREAIAELRRDEPAPAPLMTEGKTVDVTAAADPTGPSLTAVREAAMRNAVRAAAKAGHERIAFVCGAWHAPAVDPSSAPSAAADNRLLRGLPKTKVAAAWAPWTATRLSQRSGYGAGVSSPGWYRHLFVSRLTGDGADDAASSWLVRVARELRVQGMTASPASVVDAARLARTLATIRGRPHPGLSELDDAALAVLADGDRLPLTLVHRDLVVGSDIGAVPDAAPMVPLAADLQRHQKRCRLKPAAHSQTVTLDLRTDSGRARSTLLHRLVVLGVDWGEPADAGRTTGTFKEAWTLAWDPGLAVSVVEAAVYGTTVVDAATARVAAAAEEATTLGELSTLVDRCMTADLPTHDVVRVLADRAAAHSDAPELLGAIEPLARVCRYGTVRKVDTSRVRAVLDEVTVRAGIGLPSAAVALSEEAAATLRAAVDSAHRGLMMLDDPLLADRWFTALHEVTGRARVPGVLAGRAVRILLDADRIDRDEVERRMSRELSRASDPVDAAAWLDGFLSGDAMILVHDAALLDVVDRWVAGVAAETFDDLLPLLRRTFSAFSTAERRSIGRAVARGDATESAAAFDADRAGPAMAAVARLVGWESA